MKDIFICADGTWSTTLQTDRGHLSPTNVVKIARAINSTPTQLVFYDRGVGTDDDIDKIKGGVFGHGLYQNVRQAYFYIVANYEPGDNIYLFGFSRGAYTVRCLAGMITKVGILRKKYIMDIDSINTLYKGGDITAEVRNDYTHYFCHSNRDIKFLGVWDTVGSLGIPSGAFKWLNNRNYGFLNTDLSFNIKNAFHALAINEHRKPFAPTLWKSKNLSNDQVLEQRWFIGAHSNIGGGYEDTGLSDITLNWMLNKLKETNPNISLDTKYMDNSIHPNYKGEIRTEVDSWKYTRSKVHPYYRKILTNENANEVVDESVYKRTNCKEFDYTFASHMWE